MNLWAESDNQELASAPVGQAAKAGRSRRSSTEQALLPALRAWLLADYIAPYCRLLAATRIFRRCLWIDGSGGTRSATSGDKDRSKREPGLEERFVLPEESSVVNADWREVAPMLLPAIEQSAAIFLLNPLAVSKPSLSNLKGRGRPQGSKVPSPALTKSEIPYLTIDELTPLFQRTAPTELCLLLMHRQIETILLPALRTTAGAAAFTALLRSDRWKALLAQEDRNAPTMATIDKVIDLLLAFLRPHFLFVQRTAFPMQTGAATIEDAPCALLFATRRQDSLACMNDAVCGYRRHLEEKSRRGILNAAWFAARQAERDAQAMQQLSEDTLRTGRARSPRRWPDLRQQLLLDRFGQWMLREYDEVICHLLQAGELHCEWRQRQSVAGDTTSSDGSCGNAGDNNDELRCRVPGNEDVLLWQAKRGITRGKRRYGDA